MNNYLFLSLPISITGAASTLVTPVSSPVTFQESVNQVNTFTFHDNPYSNYIKPVKTDFISLIESRINSIKYLKKNWDGYGADAPDEKVINNSICFINSLPESIQSEIQPERVVPTPYGTLVFDIEKNQNLISIEVGEKNIGFFSEFSDNKNISIDKVSFNPNNLPVELNTAFRKLYL